MYPAVKKLIAIGDVHGDLRVTLIALKLAEVIPQHSTEKDLHNVHWCGGSTWIIQLGDQIDRCRPDELEKNCIKDFSDVHQDEGNNMKIIKLFLRLDEAAATAKVFGDNEDLIFFVFLTLLRVLVLLYLSPSFFAAVAPIFLFLLFLTLTF